MSRISLTQRIAALRAKAEQIDPFAVAVHNMAPAMRMRFDNWQRENRRMIDDISERDGAGGAYAAMIEREWCPLPMPEPIRSALGLPPDPVVTADMSAQQVADRWTSMVDG